MTKKPSGKPPGRPRTFSEDEALDAATRVFSEKGYEGASLADLIEAMGISRVSMYAIFGNKEALFVKALSRYTEMGERRCTALLAGCAARQGLERLLRDSVERFTNPEGHGVCYVTQGPLTDEGASAETRRWVASKRAEIELWLGRLLVRGVEQGELARNVATGDLARFYSVILQGIALQSQHGGTREELMRVVDLAMEKWPLLEGLDPVSSGPVPVN